MTFLRNFKALCIFKMNTTEWLCNIKYRGILKVSWTSLIGYKEKLKWCSVSETMSAWSNSTHITWKQLQHMPPAAESVILSKSIGNLPLFSKQPAPAVIGINCSEYKRTTYTCCTSMNHMYQGPSVLSDLDNGAVKQYCTNLARFSSKIYYYTYLCQRKMWV